MSYTQTQVPIGSAHPNGGHGHPGVPMSGPYQMLPGNAHDNFMVRGGSSISGYSPFHPVGFHAAQHNSGHLSRHPPVRIENSVVNFGTNMSSPRGQNNSHENEAPEYNASDRVPSHTKSEKIKPIDLGSKMESAAPNGPPREGEGLPNINLCANICDCLKKCLCIGGTQTTPQDEAYHATSDDARVGGTRDVETSFASSKTAAGRGRAAGAHSDTDDEDSGTVPFGKRVAKDLTSSQIKSVEVLLSRNELRTSLGNFAARITSRHLKAGEVMQMAMTTTEDVSFMPQTDIEIDADQWLSTNLWSAIKRESLDAIGEERVKLFGMRVSSNYYGGEIHSSGFALVRAIRSFDAYTEIETLDAYRALAQSSPYAIGMRNDQVEIATHEVLNELWRMPSKMPDVTSVAALTFLVELMPHTLDKEKRELEVKLLERHREHLREGKPMWSAMDVSQQIGIHLRNAQMSKGINTFSAPGINSFGGGGGGGYGGAGGGGDGGAGGAGGGGGGGGGGNKRREKMRADGMKLPPARCTNCGSMHKGGFRTCDEQCKGCGYAFCAGVRTGDCIINSKTTLTPEMCVDIDSNKLAPPLIGLMKKGNAKFNGKTVNSPAYQSRRARSTATAMASRSTRRRCRGESGGSSTRVRTSTPRPMRTSPTTSRSTTRARAASWRRSTAPTQTSWARPRSSRPSPCAA